MLTLGQQSKVLVERILCKNIAPQKIDLGSLILVADLDNVIGK